MLTIREVGRERNTSYFAMEVGRWAEVGELLREGAVPLPCSLQLAHHVGPDLEDNWAALFDTITLFRKVSHEVAAHLGYQYPQDLDDRVMVYLRTVQAGSGRGLQR